MDIQKIKEANRHSIKSHDKIYFSWIPRRTETGIKWLTWLRDVVVSENEGPYELLKREKYRYTKFWFFRTA